jgi:hypothetical protein
MIDKDIKNMPVAVTTILIAIFLTATLPVSMSLVANEAHLLEKTSRFILHRYLGYDSISNLFVDEPAGYEGSHNNQLSTTTKFIAHYQFPFPVESIYASTVNQKCFAEIKYQPGLVISRETLHFESSNMKIKNVETVYTNGKFEEQKFLPRIHVCGGTENDNSINAFESARILSLVSDFLKADVMQDLDRQRELLSEDSVAFGAKGREEIISEQKGGIESGTTYSLPFPLQVNVQAKCVSFDFLSHQRGTTSRGTEILYCDLLKNKIVRIDTLRHTLTQPAWVIKHFSS